MTNDDERRIILPGEKREIPRPGFRSREKILKRREARELATKSLAAFRKCRDHLEVTYKLLRVVQGAIIRILAGTRGPFLGLYWRVPWVRKGQVAAWEALLPPKDAVAEADAKVGVDREEGEA